MRLSAVRAAIIARLESTALDTKAGPGDKPKVNRAARAGQAMPGRRPQVQLISCGRDSTNTCDAHRARYQIVIPYQQVRHARQIGHDRIAADAERHHDPLWTLHEVEADILEVQVGDVFVESNDVSIAARRDVDVIYRRDQLAR